jgi:hypothetical protein
MYASRVGLTNKPAQLGIVLRGRRGRQSGRAAGPLTLNTKKPGRAGSRTKSWEEAWQSNTATGDSQEAVRRIPPRMSDDDSNDTRCHFLATHKAAGQIGLSYVGTSRTTSRGDSEMIYAGGKIQHPPNISDVGCQLSRAAQFPLGQRCPERQG